MSPAQRLLVPEDLSLFPHQHEGVRFLISRNRVLLADEMGLGKTIQARVAANYLMPFRTLICATATGVLNWEHEWRLWSTVATSPMAMPDSKTLIPRGTDTIIVSYGLVHRPNVTQNLARWLDIQGKLSSVIAPPKAKTLLILDEGHKIKNPRTKTSKAIYRLAKHADFIWILTGTPFQNSIIELFNLVRLCDPANFYSLERFGHEFSYHYFDGYQDRYQGIRNVEKLKKLCKPFFIRRLKSQVLKDLPPKVHSSIFVDLSDKASEEIFRKLDEDTARIQRQIESGQEVRINRSHAELLSMLGQAKVPQVCKWFDDYFDTKPDEPIVVFAYHRATIKAYYDYFKFKRKLCTCVVTGDTSGKDRKYYVDAFQSGDIQVFLANIIAAGESITLTRSCECFFTELIWNPAALSQAADRLHRMTQKSTVTIRFFLAQNSIEEKIIKALQRKMKVQDKLIDSHRTVGHGQKNKAA